MARIITPAQHCAIVSRSAAEHGGRPNMFAKFGETQAAAVKRQAAATKRAGTAADPRDFPVFKPGMSTADYVSRYETLTGSHLIAAGFWQTLNPEPAVLYAGGMLDYAPDCEELADDGAPALADVAPGADPAELAQLAEHAPADAPAAAPAAGRPGSLMGALMTGVRFSTAILRYPSGRFGIVGSVPAQLVTAEGQSMAWATEGEAVAALLAIGCTRFQLADCSFYKPAAPVDAAAPASAPAAPINQAPAAPDPAPAAPRQSAPVLPLFAHIALERLQCSADLRNPAQLAELLRAYAGIYGVTCDDGTAAAALAHCVQRWPDQFGPAGADPAPAADPGPAAGAAPADVDPADLVEVKAAAVADDAAAPAGCTPYRAIQDSAPAGQDPAADDLAADVAEWIAKTWPRLADDPRPRAGLTLAAQNERQRAARIHGRYAEIAAACADTLQARADALPVPPAATRTHAPFDGFGGEWNNIRNGRAEPDEYRAHVIEAIQAAKSAGLFYNSDTYPRAAAIMAARWDYPDAREAADCGDDGVPRGFGSHCYMAGDVIRAQAEREAHRQAREDLRLAVGVKLGALVFNDYKLTRGAEVVEVFDDGERVTLAGNRGARAVRIQCGPLQVRHAIERAHEKGKRRDSFAEFCAGRPAAAAGTPCQAISIDAEPVAIQAEPAAPAAAPVDLVALALARLVELGWTVGPYPGTVCRMFDGVGPMGTMITPRGTRRPFTSADDCGNLRAKLGDDVLCKQSAASSPDDARRRAANLAEDVADWVKAKQRANGYRPPVDDDEPDPPTPPRGGAPDLAGRLALAARMDATALRCAEINPRRAAVAAEIASEARAEHAACQAEPGDIAAARRMGGEDWHRGDAMRNESAMRSGGHWSAAEWAAYCEGYEAAADSAANVAEAVASAYGDGTDPATLADIKEAHDLAAALAATVDRATSCGPVAVRLLRSQAARIRSHADGQPVRVAARYLVAAAMLAALAMRRAADLAEPAGLPAGPVPIKPARILRAAQHLQPGARRAAPVAAGGAGTIGRAGPTCYPWRAAGGAGQLARPPPGR